MRFVPFSRRKIFPQIVKTVPVMRRLIADAFVLEQGRELPKRSLVIGILAIAQKFDQ